MGSSWWIAPTKREGKGNNALLLPEAFHHIEKNIWNAITDKNMEKEASGKTRVAC